MAGWDYGSGVFTLTTAGPTYVWIPTDVLGNPLALAGTTSIRLNIRQPADNVGIRIFASGDLNSGWQITVDATNVTFRKLTFGVLATAVLTQAHGLTAGLTFVIEARPVGTDIEIYINNAPAKLCHYDISTSGAPTYAGLNNWGLAGATTGAVVNRVEILTLAQVYVSRTDVMWAVCGGELWADAGSGITLIGRALFNPVGPADGDDGDQKVKIVDGLHAVTFDPVTMTATPYTPSEGQLPGKTVAGTTTATLLRFYLGRAVVNEDQNLWFSAVNNPDDFNTGKDIPGSAFALAAANAAKIGQPVRALFVAAKTRLLIGCAHSIWEMRGDPALGSVEINRLIDGVGVSGKDAFAMVAEGMVVAHTTQGLVGIPDGGLPHFLSRTVLSKFLHIDAALSNFIVQIRRDTNRNGTHIFLTAGAAGVGSTHLWYDERIGQFRAPESIYSQPGTGAGYFPEVYPDRVGPCASCVFNGNVMMGGRDGYIYVFNDAAKTDDGDAIDSYAAADLVVSPDLDNDTRVNGMDIALGVGSDPVQVSIYTGQTPEDAYEGPTRTLRRRLTVTNLRASPTINVRAPALVIEFGPSAPNTAWKVEACQFDAEEMSLTYGARIPKPAAAPPSGPYVAPVVGATNTGGGSGTGGNPGPGGGGDTCTACATWMALNTNAVYNGHSAYKLGATGTWASLQTAAKTFATLLATANVCGFNEKNALIWITNGVPKQYTLQGFIGSTPIDGNNNWNAYFTCEDAGGGVA